MLKIIILPMLLLIDSSLFAHDPHPIEKPTKSTFLATAKKRTSKARHPWPFTPLSIGHTMSSYQNYGNSPYFHHGIDPRVPAGTSILSSTAGKVVNIENYMSGSAYWEVAVLDTEGFIWQYHHVDRNSIPSSIWTAFKTGSPIAQGTKLGEIFYWNWSAFGERFHHLHLNILDSAGNYLNPFHFLEKIDDEQAPKIVKVGILKNGQAVTGNYISGNYSIYAKIHDLIKHDKFVVPPYSISYRLDNAPEVLVWKFDGLPGGNSTEKFVDKFYVQSMTCGNYNCRELTVNLGFHKTTMRNFPNEPGRYQIEIIARDYAENETSESFSWTVTQ